MFWKIRTSSVVVVVVEVVVVAVVLQLERRWSQSWKSVRWLPIFGYLEKDEN